MGSNRVPAPTAVGGTSTNDPWGTGATLFGADTGATSNGSRMPFAVMGGFGQPQQPQQPSVQTQFQPQAFLSSGFQNERAAPATTWSITSVCPVCRDGGLFLFFFIKVNFLIKQQQPQPPPQPQPQQKSAFVHSRFSFAVEPNAAPVPLPFSFSLFLFPFPTHDTNVMKWQTSSAAVDAWSSLPFASPASSAFPSPHGLAGATPFGFGSQPQPQQQTSLLDGAGTGAGGAGIGIGGGWGMPAGNSNSGAQSLFSGGWNPVQMPSFFNSAKP
jgi:hypothetical protein